MVKQRMDLLELLRKRGIDGDVDFLRVLVDGIMDAEVSAQIGAQHGERSPERDTTEPPFALTLLSGACAFRVTFSPTTYTGRTQNHKRYR